LAEDDRSFTYRLLGERLLRIKEQKDASDEAAARRLREYEEIAAELLKAKQEPKRLNLERPGEHALYVVLREHAAIKDEEYLAECARRIVAHLRDYNLLTTGWSNTIGGRMRVEQSLLAESWNEFYAKLGFNPNDEHPPFLKAAIEELADATG
jgi:type I restriction enzyme R subunit